MDVCFYNCNFLSGFVMLIVQNSEIFVKGKIDISFSKAKVNVLLIFFSYFSTI